MFIGGFGLVLDGSEEADRRAESMLNWDVSNGVARRFFCKLFFFFVCLQLDNWINSAILIRGWSGNANAIQAIQRAMAVDPRLKVTLPNPVDESAYF